MTASGTELTSRTQALTRAATTRFGSAISTERLATSSAIVIVGFLVLVPIIYLLQGTLTAQTGGGVSFSNIREAYTDSSLLPMIWNSIEFSVGTVVVAMVIGVPLAYLAVRTDIPLKGLIYATALIPMIIPGVLYTVSWIFLLSPRIGAINKFFEPLVGTGGIFNIFSVPGMIFVEGVHTVPIVFLLMFGTFRNMDPSLEESATVSGARPIKVLFRITLPVLRPGLLLCALIVSIRGLSAFEVPQLLGAPSKIWVFTSKMYTSLLRVPVDYGTAGSYALGLLLALALLALAQSRLTRNSESYQTVTGKGFRPSVVTLGRLRLPTMILVTCYLLLTLVLPILILLYASLRGFYSVPTMESLHQLTFANYSALFAESGITHAFVNTLILALASATIIMALTSMVAWTVVKRRGRGTNILSVLTMSPLGIPGLVLGVALLFFYLRVPLPIYGSDWILLIAFVTIFLPYGLIYASGGMQQVANELEESAAVCGSGFLRVFYKVTAPILLPALLSGWIFIVLLAVRELGAALLLYSPGNEVLSIVIWTDWYNGDLSGVAAIGFVLMAALLVLVLVARKLGAKVGVRA